MSNIDKQELREAAERAESDSWGYDRDEFNEALTPSTVLALLDELEAAEKLNAELMEKQRLIDICQGQGLEHRIAAEKRAEAAEKRIAELERKEQHSERQSVIDALAGSGEEWSDIEEYMQKWDAERAAAAGKGEAS
ncbi:MULTISPECIES: ead/Ea22-like family protein [Enterobacter cloacae complex]|uniref:ead/Ea22-like family protein n=1 Tax=Enterobacter cloacae complex TaxID=354276 RepID=UPI0019D313EC|nr:MULTISPECIES: ead/Ea22-like family protein [Enterobacter cloacae complex]MCO7416041.1 ead/Ea22-like family protein [Enterobacter asburiae]UBM18387.1 ead/Ea22-like family protein [Enterobacter cloacae complex sp. ECL352]HBK4845823.1 ead/Ea22-like family protein [Enterobacter asburiae]HED1216227.1 ead/Ea22-like family protein [Enterobacter asburiae]